ncbi:DUF1549 domain-containing protein [Tautonia plasticadhaerens]|uniref:Bacterial Ig-like domain (Group 2) n=1 Tax=Tautonia plasticadhaerens TaxID=2527974 RepID=A0A518HAK1_9BACT|nr:DUF1549 domain-containing protein [Tautonia plasticadhaerens]QDV37880.1 Bacterial Ig-like domain (group 2) [Tautonia plasticadhaerens]
MLRRPNPGRILRGPWPVLVALTLSGPSPAVADDGQPGGSIGQPASLAVEPGDAVLSGRRATAQLIATATDPDGSVRDLTRLVEWASLDPDVAVVDPRGRVVPVADGQARIVASGGSVEARTTVTVQQMGSPDPVSFRHDVMPALSQASCNTGACHGTPTGKGGFRLSLLGYLPDEDYRVLSREIAGRRVDPFDPDNSMILTKPLGLIAHEGGQRLFRDTKTFEFLRDWIAEGVKDDPESPRAVSLEIVPGDRILHAPAISQQVVARVSYADGSTRDVTPICYYGSSNTDIAEVDASGFVSFKKRGEVAVIAHYLDLVAVVRLTHLVEVPGFAEVDVPTDNLVDRAVFDKLNRMRIAPSEPCTDEEFIRRAYLDTIGVMPTPGETKAFLDDPSPTRYEEIVETLLERPEFNDFWALKFADVLRSNSRLIKSKGAYAFHRWIRSQIEQNAPIDGFVRQLLTAEGSTFDNPAANYYRISRTPEEAVETTAQLFLGVRIQCAKCHNHPFERWTQDDYYGFAAFFSRVKQKPGLLPDEEIIFAADSGDVRQPRTNAVMPPKALGGPVYGDDEREDSRKNRLAEWLTGEENDFFAKSTVNRIWYHVMGKGIVDPVDDFRDSNPASNDELLDDLAADFVSSGYDLRHLVRTILTSRTYRLSARTHDLNADDEIYFSHAVTKLLPAEVLLDAISSVADVPTAFNGLPAGSSAIEIPDGQMDHPFLKTFGRPARELACECERESDSNLSQALQLIGGSTVHDKLRADGGRMHRLAESGKPAAEVTADLYAVALSRPPTDAELEAAVAHIAGAGAEGRRQAIEDLGWVLINSKEFLFRH